jgi:hypothetical protein
VSRKKEQYYLQHSEEYWELFRASQQVKTKEEMKQINKKIRKLFGRDRAIPVEARFPTDTRWMPWATICLGAASILISLVSMLLPILIK